MDGSSWALLLRPLAAIILLGLIVLPICILIDKIWPDGPVKRFLFKRRGK